MQATSGYVDTLTRRERRAEKKAASRGVFVKQEFLAGLHKRIDNLTVDLANTLSALNDETTARKAALHSLRVIGEERDALELQKAAWQSERAELTGQVEGLTVERDHYHMAYCKLRRDLDGVEHCVVCRCPLDPHDILRCADCSALDRKDSRQIPADLEDRATAAAEAVVADEFRTKWGVVHEELSAALRAAPAVDETPEAPLKIDHEWTDNPVCPHCGAEGSGEGLDDAMEEEVDCHSCGRTFLCTVDYDVSWITSKKDGEEEKASENQDDGDAQAESGAEK